MVEDKNVEGLENLLKKIKLVSKNISLLGLPDEVVEKIKKAASISDAHHLHEKHIASLELYNFSTEKQ